jgi:hypothetical protein
MTNKFCNYLYNRHKILTGSILCLFAVCIVAQTSKNKPNTLPTKQIIHRKGTKVNLEYASVLEYDKFRGADYQLLHDSVRFRQDHMYMYCDSAKFFDKTNSLEAFGNVKMQQGDTLFVYSDYLYYDGNTQLAKLRYNVKMENRNVTLLTDSLNYDRRLNIGYFFNGGVISDLQNELTSVYGQYSPTTKMADFRYNVKLVNDKMTIYSDTLHYNTATKVANIAGPSTILSDQNTIYTDKGWYNTLKENSMLFNRSLLVTKGKTLTGDTLCYNRKKGIGEAFGYMHLKDSVNKADLYGNYGYYNENTRKAFSTKLAWAREYSRPDTMFISADTLMATEPDTTYRVLSAFHRARFYSKNSQGVSDSLQYSSRDSILHLYRDPVLWNANYQLAGDTIHAYMNDSTIKMALVKGYSLAIEQLDSIKGFYNQLSGKSLRADFEHGDIRKVDVSGNVETIFYPLDKDSTMIGLNHSESSYLTMWLLNRKLERLKMWPTVTGSMTPEEAIKQNQKQLKNFRWYSQTRPRSPMDIFRHKNTKIEPVKRIQRRSR